MQVYGKKACRAKDDASDCQKIQDKGEGNPEEEIQAEDPVIFRIQKEREQNPRRDRKEGVREKKQYAARTCAHLPRSLYQPFWGQKRELLRKREQEDPQPRFLLLDIRNCLLKNIWKCRRLTW